MAGSEEILRNLLLKVREENAKAHTVFYSFKKKQYYVNRNTNSDQLEKKIEIAAAMIFLDTETFRDCVYRPKIKICLLLVRKIMIDL